MARTGDRSTASGTGRAVRACLVAAALGFSIAGTATADELSGYVEFAVSDFSSEREDSAGRTTETESDSFYQRYNLLVDKWFYPHLRMRTGGFFEARDTTLTVSGDDTDTTTTRIGPFFNLTLRTPLYLAKLSYDRNEDRQKTEGVSSNTDVRETYAANLAFFPDGLPTIRVDYFHTNAYDEAGLLRDNSEDRFQLQSEYQPVKALRLIYRGALEQTEDGINEVTIENWSHTARASYMDSFWNRRVRLNSDYRLTYRSTTITTSGSGEVRFPIFRLAGYSTIDDLVDPVTLDPNPALVDGDVTNDSGINLGPPDPGEDDRARQLGLDLAGERELNTLLVWTDVNLTTDLVAAYSWDVYVSDDNVEWVLHQGLLVAEFEPFLRRFELRFSDVITRYVKVVVSPLSPSDPLAVEFPDVRITELQAERIEDAADVDRDDRRTSHLLNVDARAKILETPALFYEMNYFLTKDEPGYTSHTLSNGLSLNHRFNRVYTVAARVAHEDDRRPAGDFTAFLYSASMTASALDTLRHRLVFSGRKEDGISDSRDSQSLYLFNTMQLYRGIDLNVGLGMTGATRSTGEVSEGEEINASATLVPHRTMTFNLTYRDRTDESWGVPPGVFLVRETTTGQASVAYNPLSTLYLYGSYRVDRRSDLPRRSFSNYSINWSPFRDGTLQLSLRFDERLRSEDDAEETIITPRLRWSFARGSYFDLAYQKLTIRAISQDVDDETLLANLRFAF